MNLGRRDAMNTREQRLFNLHQLWTWFAVLMIVLVGSERMSAADVLVLKNGMQVRGAFTKIPSISGDLFSSSGGAGGVDVNLVVVVDDGLRRVFFSTYQLADIQPEVERLESIKLRQPVATGAAALGSLGAFVKPPEPFDDFGRRVLSMASSSGPLDIVQGITEVTPVFVRVQTLQSGRPYEWDLRLATSSLPRDTLSRILRSHLRRDNLDERLSIVRLYLQSKRYEDAAQEIEAVLADFPEVNDLGQQLGEIRRLHAQQLIAELKLRQSAGQHHLVTGLLQAFSDNLPMDVLLEVGELHDEYTQKVARVTQIIEQCQRLADHMEPGAQHDSMSQLLDELRVDLSLNTVDRMADFERLAIGADLNDEQKLALALSGWLTGGFATENAALARSLWRVRELLRSYLVSQHDAEREALLREMESEEANTPLHLARLLAAMKPPWAELGGVKNETEDQVPEGADPWPGERTPQANESTGTPGYFEFSIAGIDQESTIDYVVQLPPEYDPYRRYPAVITLHAARSTPQLQVDWWAGGYDAERKTRTGQATRHGYIVIAPNWTEPGQRRYQYSAREHAAVLYSLRDAAQRFAIDSDRVFLSGHSLGGDAAWDIGLAHPDLWAGVIPLGATAVYDAPRSPKYVSLYWENARAIPMYFVAGDRDIKSLRANARDFNRYFKRSGFDAMAIEYLGHGNESFYEEIQNVFTWMGLHRRDFHRDEFKVFTLRPWDNFFWWAEVSELPSRAVLLPAAWPERGAARPTQIEGLIRERKNVQLTTGAAMATVYLGPGHVDFDAGVMISINGKIRARGVTPDSKVLLEDARRRGDRMHPFWSKTEVETGRRVR